MCIHKGTREVDTHKKIMTNDCVVDSIILNIANEKKLF